MTLEDPFKKKELIKKLNQLRTRVHAEMEIEGKRRMETSPEPTENELRLAAFIEWIEPQVREAVTEMYRKGYGTKSSGFYGGNNSFQAIDGYFFIDDETKKKIKAMGAEVLNGPEMGVPLNDIIMQIRFSPDTDDLGSIKKKWDTIVAVLPPRQEGPRAICDRAEEFREEYSPDYPSLQNEIDEYFSFLRNKAKQGNV